MSLEIINVNDYVTIVTFAKKVGVNSSLIRYYAKNKGIKSVTIDGYIFIHLDSVKEWPPKPRKSGRPAKNPT